MHSADIVVKYKPPYPFARWEREVLHHQRMNDYLELSDDALAIMAGEDPSEAQNSYITPIGVFVG